MNRRNFVKNTAALAVAGIGGSNTLYSRSSFVSEKPDSKLRNDMRSEPVKRLVVMGESNAYGMSAGDPSNEWVQTLASLMRKFQDAPLRVFNNAIPANVISPDAPGYDPKVINATAPSAIERFEDDMISYKPDMAVYAYGLNDSRCGHSTKSFIDAYWKILHKTRESLPNALIVLVGPYWNLQYDAKAWADSQFYLRGDKFDIPGDELVLSYNAEIAKLAKEVNAIFVDVYSVLEGATWLLNHDSIHFNDVGHSIIGQTVFIKIASHCSFLSAKSKRFETELNLGTRNTGGTNALPQVISKWRNVNNWKR